MIKKLSIKWQISILSALFILISIITTYSVVSILDQQRLDSGVINIAGRQRMLIQKFTKEIFLESILDGNSEKPYKKTEKLFNVSLDALRNGGNTFSDLGMTKEIAMPAATDQAVLDGLDKVAKLWKYEEKALLAILGQDVVSDEELRALNKKSDELLGEMNKVVGLLTKISQNKVEFLINESELLLLGTVVIGVLLSYYIITSVTKPLKALIRISTAFDSGDLSLMVPEALRKGNNEVGTLAKVTESMRARLEILLRSIQLSSMEMKNTAQQVSYISKAIISAADEQESKSEQVQSSVDSLSDIAVVVREEVAQASEFVKRSEVNAGEGITVAHKNITELDITVRGVNEASDMILNLKESAEEMHNIVDSIQKIAAQTNLLALNAAIEAARAGEQGRGFAVVADEVRTLASRTSSSTDEITALIESFSSKVGNSVTSMANLVSQVNKVQGHSRETITSFEAMGVDVANTAGSNQQILKYNEQQTGQVTQLSDQFQDLFMALENSASKADSTSLIAESLYGNAESMLQSVNGYTVGQVATEPTHEGQEQRKEPRVKSNISAVVHMGSDLNMNVLIEDVSATGCKVIAKQALNEKCVSITLRIPSEDMNSYASQEKLKLSANIVRDGEGVGLDSSDMRYHYGLEFTNVDTINEKQLRLLMSCYVDVA